MKGCCEFALPDLLPAELLLVLPVLLCALSSLFCEPDLWKGELLTAALIGGDGWPPRLSCCCWLGRTMGPPRSTSPGCNRGIPEPLDEEPLGPSPTSTSGSSMLKRRLGVVGVRR